MEWIKVEDKLPNCTNNVFDDNDEYKESDIVLVVIKLKSGMQYKTIARMDMYEHWEIMDGFSNPDRAKMITHWMPLPELPNN